ncbi:DUF4262 domain-containing protein [Nocardia sp. NPDC004722]
MSSSDCQCVMCRDYGDRDEMHPGDQRLVDNVGKRGWGVIAIPESDSNPHWAFTVGLWHSHRVPEIALFGVPPNESIAILNAIGDQAATGTPLEIGHHLDNILAADYQLTLHPIAAAWRRPFFGTAIRFYRNASDWPILHCVYAPAPDHLQPQLALPPADHPTGAWTSYHAEWLAWSGHHA